MPQIPPKAASAVSTWLGDPLTSDHAVSVAIGAVLVASLHDLGDNGATSTINNRPLPPRICDEPTIANAVAGGRFPSDWLGRSSTVGFCIYHPCNDL